MNASSNGTMQKVNMSLNAMQYHELVFNGIENLQKQGVFTDITLISGTELFGAHRMILSICSGYFQAILDKINLPNPIVVLEDIAPDILKCILNFIYTGKVTICKSNLKAFMKAGSYLKVKGLFDELLNKPTDFEINQEIKSTISSKKRFAPKNKACPASKKPKLQSLEQNEPVEASHVKENKEVTINLPKIVTPTLKNVDRSSRRCSGSSDTISYDLASNQLIHQLTSDNEVQIKRSLRSSKSQKLMAGSSSNNSHTDSDNSIDFLGVEKSKSTHDISQLKKGWNSIIYQDLIPDTTLVPGSAEEEKKLKSTLENNDSEDSDIEVLTESSENPNLESEDNSINKLDEEASSLMDTILDNAAECSKTIKTNNLQHSLFDPDIVDTTDAPFLGFNESGPKKYLIFETLLSK